MNVEAHAVAARLLSIMDRKHHWAYPALTRPGLTRAQLLEHFRHEYLVYVRDFPQLLARALGEVPPLVDVRTALAENLYEEQTGRLSGTAAHPELFLCMMEGLGFARADFDEGAGPLHAHAVEYRDWLRDAAVRSPWQAGVAVLTIFVEGSVHERAELGGTFVRARGDAAVRTHPMVVHYGCPPEAMQLRRAHAAIEGSHRADAWRILLWHVPEHGEVAERVVETCSYALSMWQRYRDAVASRMGLRPSDRAA